MEFLPLESLHEDIDPDNPYILGIDEAGRGPVLGPMVYACCYCPLSEKNIMKTMGFADSKILTEEQRSDLFDKIRESKMLEFIVDPIMPETLSGKMSRLSKVNLNQISHQSAIGLIRKALAKNVKITEVYVDTVGPPETYQSLLKSFYPSIDIKVSKKADSLYPIVSAASICAKVSRDHILSKWKFQEGQDIGRLFGSGYPGDPTTRSWLKENLDPVFGFPSLVRFSWKTCDTILKRRACEIKWAEEPPENDERYSKNKGEAQTKLDFRPKCKRTKFFEENNILYSKDFI